MGRWQILRKATEKAVAAVWAQAKRAKPSRKRIQFVESLETRTLLSGALLKDIDITPAMDGPFNLTNVGGTYFFSHTDSSGRELWKSDGTESGTVKVKDIDPGRSSSQPNQFIGVGSTVYFTANTSAGRELWKSDGTSSGTVLVKDINTGSENSDPMMIGAIGSTLYFTAKTSTDGRELWKTDGTESGTVLVKDIYSGTNDSNISTGDFAIVGSNLYFVAQSSVGGSELWMTDGTSSGTVQVKDIISGSGSSWPSNLIVFGGEVYFSADDGSSGSELWKSDGSESGTVLVKNINPNMSSGSNPGGFKIFDGELYFNATTNADGNELWKTDGTTLGTVIVRDINNGSAWSSPYNFTIVDDQMFFVANTAEYGQELWVTDGTYSGTVQVKDINDSGSNSSNPQNFVAIDDVLYFAATGAAYGTELWKSDGTSSGTVKIKDIEYGTGSSWPNNLIDVNGTLFFTAMTSNEGSELWKSDGTESGTALVKDIWSGTQGANPFSFQASGSTLFFVATDTSYGIEIWKSDGTESGTAVVKDANPGTHHSDPQSFVNAGYYIYFAADDGVNGHELWKSDGTSSGTTLIKDIWAGSNSSNPSNFIVMDSVLYFTADTNSEGRELWRSDGTANGTYRVKDINTSGGSSPDSFRVIDDTLFFTAWTSSSGTELWKSDGTESGTVMVKDIRSGSSGSDIQSHSLVVMDDLLYFSATSDDYGQELWVSDGTESGTVMVKDIVSGTGGSSVSRLAVIGNTLYFSAYTSTDGSELWKSDGTESGTVLFKDIASGNTSSNPDKLTAVGSTLYFRAYTSSDGVELWKSDGTVNGTVLVKDIESGSSNSNPDYLFASGNTLYFFADTTPKGSELWVSDGTSSGTVLVKDINTGASSTNPSSMLSLNGGVYMVVNEGWSNSVWRSDGTAGGTSRLVAEAGGGSNSIITFNGSIVFTADDGAHGREVWIIRPPEAEAGEYEIDQDTFAELDGSESSDSDPETTLTYEWDLDADGIFGETGGSATRGDEVGMTPEFSSAGLPGETPYTVYLKVTNSSGLIDIDSTAIDINCAVPSELVATAISDHRINLTWVDHAISESGYVVHRSENSDFSDFTSTTLNAGSTSLSVSGLSHDTTYYFRVKAIFSGGTWSAWSIADSEDTMDTLPPPSIVFQSFNFETNPNKLIFQFDQDVSASLSVDDLSVFMEGADARLATSGFSLSYNTATNTATFTCPYTVMFTGDYYAQILASDVADDTNQTMGADYRFNFFSLGSDVNHDRTADAADLAIITGNLNTAGTFSDGDINYDEFVDSSDEFAFTAQELLEPIHPVGKLSVWTNGNDRDLAWHVDSKRITNVRVQRSLDRKTWSTIATLGPTANTYADTTASGQNYYYRVRGVYVSTATNHTYTLYRKPGDPTQSQPGSVDVDQIAKNSVRLNWADTNSDEVGYEVWKSLDNTNWTKVKTTDANATNLTITNLKADRLQYFKVRAIGADNVSKFVSSSATTLSGAPAVIGGWLDVSAVPHKFYAEIDQEIVDVGSAADTSMANLSGYVELASSTRTIAIGAGSETVKATIQGDVGGVVSGALPEGNYEFILKEGSIEKTGEIFNPDEGVAIGFFVRGDFDGDREITDKDLAIVSANYGGSNKTYLQGDSDYDGDVDFADMLYVAQRNGVFLAEPPNSPGELVVYTATLEDPTHEMKLDWTAPEEDVDGFKIFRGTDGVNFTQIDDVDAETFTFTDSELTDGTKYWYRIRGYIDTGNGIEYSSTSNKASGVTLLAAPFDLDVTQEENGVSLSWTAPSQASGVIYWVSYGYAVDPEDSMDGENVIWIDSIEVDPNETSLLIEENIPSGSNLVFQVEVENEVSHTVSPFDTISTPPGPVESVTLENLPGTDGEFDWDSLKLTFEDDQNNIDRYEIWMTSPTEQLWKIITPQSNPGNDTLAGHVTPANHAGHAGVTAIASLNAQARINLFVNTQQSYVYDEAIVGPINGLDPNETYVFAVKPVVIGGPEIDETASEERATGRQPAGLSVNIWPIELTSYSVDLNWTPLQNVAAAFELYRQEKVGQNWTPYELIGTYGAEAFEAHISGLNELTEYNFKLRTIWHDDRFTTSTWNLVTESDESNEVDRGDAPPTINVISEGNNVYTFPTDYVFASDESHGYWEYEWGYGWVRSTVAPNHVNNQVVFGVHGSTPISASHLSTIENVRIRFKNEFHDKILWSTSVHRDPWPQHSQPLADSLRATASADLVLDYYDEWVISVEGEMELSTRVFLGLLTKDPQDDVWTSHWNDFGVYGIEEHWWAPFEETLHPVFSGQTALGYYQTNNWSSWDAATKLGPFTAPDWNPEDGFEAEDGEDSPMPVITAIEELSATSNAVTIRDNSTNEIDFELERSRDGIHWSKATPSATYPSSRTIVLTDSGLEPGSTYEYRVRAWRETITDIPVLPDEPNAGFLTAFEFTDWSEVVGMPNIAVDSNNNGGIESGGSDEAIENASNTPGSIVVVGSDDLDEDLQPDFADWEFEDGSNGGPQLAALTPITFSLPSSFDLENDKIQIKYIASPPQDVIVSGDSEPYTYTPALGQIRLWKVNSAGRDPNGFLDTGDYVPPIEGTTWYDGEDLQTLGFSDSNRHITLWVEAIQHSDEAGDIEIEFKIDFEGSTDLAAMSDVVRLSAVKGDIGFNNDNGPESDPDDKLLPGSPDINYIIDEDDERTEGVVKYASWWGWGMTADVHQMDLPDIENLTPFVVDIPQILVDSGFEPMLRLDVAGSTDAVFYAYPNLGTDRMAYLEDVQLAQQILAQGEDDGDWIMLRAGSPTSYQYLADADGVNYGAGHHEFLIRGVGEGICFANFSFVMINSDGRQVVLDSARVTYKPVEEFYSVISSRDEDQRTPFAYPGDDNRTETIDAYQYEVTRDKRQDGVKNTAIFVHGYNTSAESAENAFTKVFKRLHWQGFRGNFVGWSWDGNEWDMPFGLPSEFDVNVTNALETSPALWMAIRNLMQESEANGGWGLAADDIDLLAHSLGNLVVWDAVRINAAKTTDKLVNNVVNIQAALWSEAFDPVNNLSYSLPVRDENGDIISSYPINLTVAEQQQSSWRSWFNPGTPGSIKSSITGNVINSYFEDDGALDVMMANDYFWRASDMLDRSDFYEDPPVYRTSSNLAYLPTFVVSGSIYDTGTVAIGWFFEHDQLRKPIGTHVNPLADVNVDASQFEWGIDSDTNPNLHSDFITEWYPQMFRWWKEIFVTNGGVRIGIQ